LYSSESPVYIHSNDLHIKWDINEDASEINIYSIKITNNKNNPEIFQYTQDFKCLNCPEIKESEPFIVLLKAENKAGLTKQILLGPILIDVTPPEFAENSIDVITNDMYVIFAWPVTMFYDDDDDDSEQLLEYDWCIGNTTYNPVK
jgi:hypothetical protein